MQIMITHSRMARTRVLHFARWQLLLAAVAAALLLMLTSGAVYHYLFLRAAQERWPVVGQLVRWVVREDLAARERWMRENLDAMAQKVGEMQARVVTLQMMGERVSGLAGLKPEDLRPAAEPASAASAAGRGGPFRTQPPRARQLSPLFHPYRRLQQQPHRSVPRGCLRLSQPSTTLCTVVRHHQQQQQWRQGQH